MKPREPSNEPRQSIEEEIDDVYQYEALIEQLRYEKQTYAHKCKEYVALLQMIYERDKNKWETTPEKPFEKMKFDELKQVFNLTK